MNNLSSKQRFVLWVALVLSIAMFLFPPVGFPTTYGRNLARGFRFLFTMGEESLVIDIPRLLIQYGLLAAAAWLTVVSLRPKP